MVSCTSEHYVLPLRLLGVFPPISGRQPQFTSPTPENSGDFLFARPVLNSSSPATRRNPPSLRAVFMEPSAAGEFSSSPATCTLALV